jgi:hypothetical protein
VSNPLAIALQLILLHRVDGGEVIVNPAHVTALHVTAAATGQKNKLLTYDVRCVLYLSDGKIVSVIEPCNMVKKLLEEAVQNDR